MAWQTLHYMHAPETFFSTAQRHYGDLFTIHILHQKWVVLAHPDAIKEVFSYGPSELNSGEANHALRPVIGSKNLLLLDDREHLQRRRMVLPSFHGEHMRAHEDVIRDAITSELESWPLSTPIAVLPRMSSLISSIMLRCIFGLNEAERVSPLAVTLRRIFTWITDPRRLLVFFLLGPERLMRLPGFRRQIQVIDREVLAEIKHRRGLDDLQQKQDIMSLLIQLRDDSGNSLTDTELRDELITLLLAGHQNTATLIAWATHELARDHNSQDHLAKEPKTWADAVVTETLRLRPPVPLVVRRLRKPLTIAGYRLPAGTNIAPCALLVHRRADLYPQPLSFQPQRFLKRRPPPHEWFPFGGSVRRCIGASFAQFEARIILEEITRTLHITPQHTKPERTKPRAIVLVPAHGTRIIATKR